MNVNPLLKSIKELFSVRDFAGVVSFFSDNEEKLSSIQDPLEIKALSLIELKRFSEAAETARKGTELFPEYHKFHFLTALASESAGNNKSALKFYSSTLMLDPDFVPALCNQGKLFLNAGKVFEANKLLQKAVELAPDNYEVKINAGNAKGASGDINGAISLYRKALELAPNNHAAIANILLNLHYSSKFSTSEIFEEHLRFARTIEQNVPEKFNLKPSPVKNRKIRVGYVSADFRRHSVAYFIEPVIHGHDRNAFEIYCYYDSYTVDAVTERLIDMSDKWTVIKDEDNLSVARKVLDDKIDILVDLGGYTGVRMPLFAMKPAPVQLTYLGYINTTGLSTMDYILTDDTAEPPGSEKFHKEKLIKTPGCSLCFAPPEDVPEPSEPPFLKNGYITFGSMNNIRKLDDSVIETWSAILRKVPDSRLCLKNKSFSDQGVRDSFSAKFNSNGINPDRVEFVGFIPDLSSHMEFYGRVDIALDTFPFNGVTTTCEALWMGVPVITLCGDRYSGRIATSILKEISMDALSADSRREYVNKTVFLAGEKDMLIDFRKSLRTIMASSGLCYSKVFTASIDSLYKSFFSCFF